jgi:hypothetical protein
MLPWQYYIINMSWFFQGPPRLSGLEAPIMMLTGHEGDIFTCKFSPDGQMHLYICRTTCTFVLVMETNC